MSRKLDRLTARSVQTIKTPGLHGDGGGLYLSVTHAKSGGRTIDGKSWIFRFTDPVTGKRRDAGLGPAWDVPLVKARERAAEYREMLRRGESPIENTRQKRTDARAEHARALTFAQCAERYIKAHRAGWRNAKHAAQWTSTLETYAAPINNLMVAAIDTAMVLQCLEPHWADKHETMTRVRQRIEAVLDWASARKYRSGENPARWKGHLDKLLPAIPKKKRVVHRPALPYAAAPQFMAKLRKREGMGARCLEMQILTATRPGEAAGAQWSEIDLAAKVWTVPATRMKAGVEHRIPLSDAAVKMLKALSRVDDHVFPGIKGRSITTMAALELVRDMHPGIVPHGFRSTFRDWAGDCTSFPRDIAEAALAHTVKGVEGDYRRGDAFHKRTALMSAWAQFLGQHKRH